MSQNLARLLAAAFLAIGIALAGYFASQTIYKSRVAVNSAEVKGLAERIVDADQANWGIDLELRVASRSEVSGALKQMRAQQEALAAIARDAGFSDEQIHAGDISYRYDEIRNNQSVVVDSYYVITAGMIFYTADFNAIEKMKPAVADYITQSLEIPGMLVRRGEVYYKFTSLNAIKTDMLKEATQNARLAAREFAENADVHVGGIRSARQGGFTVRDVGSDYSEDLQPRKTVRVVTTIEFYLTD
jgi:hypothetical protein